ncbi:MAG: hypothetical protein HYV26_07285 [Candidatus Hydrogenedentes bacterium]|nr:hypothetical protein [Candidatus Hydrogenedentota bacterium]MBI3119681.1 hypothetical protein [Candidatus Hydrogenedentota bacterium]
MATQKRHPSSPLRRRGRKKPEPKIVLDPDRWGMIVGLFLATLVLVVDFFRGPSASLNLHTLIGAGLTFVISYLVTGLFVWYLRGVRERELEPASPARPRLGDAVSHEPAETAETAGAPAQEGPRTS